MQCSKIAQEIFLCLALGLVCCLQRFAHRRLFMVTSTRGRDRGFDRGEMGEGQGTSGTGRCNNPKKAMPRASCRAVVTARRKTKARQGRRSGWRAPQRMTMTECGQTAGLVARQRRQVGPERKSYVSDTGQILRHQVGMPIHAACGAPKTTGWMAI